jgi:hypothetical protein
VILLHKGRRYWRAHGSCSFELSASTTWAYANGGRRGSKAMASPSFSEAGDRVTVRYAHEKNRSAQKEESVCTAPKICNA